MKRFFLMMVTVVVLLSCGKVTVAPVAQGDGGVDSVESEVVSGYDSEKVTQGSWMGLFLGMGQVEEKKADGDSHYRYECQVPELDGVEGIARQELEATWYHNDEDNPSRYRCTMGLYVDKNFPSSEIFNQVERGIDTLLVQSFYCYEELNALKASLEKRTGYKPRGTKDILDRAKSVFDAFTRVMHPTKAVSDYSNYPESRICIVAHKIYDKGDWASYIIEFSFSYNGSNGSPSWADYITVNKKTGKRLTAVDIEKKYGAAQVEEKLRKAYEKGKKERNTDLDVYDLTGKELIDCADGCAIVNEGVMFYYRPYSVGSGAEGEYNLVLDLPWP